MSHSESTLKVMECSEKRAFCTEIYSRNWEELTVKVEIASKQFRLSVKIDFSNIEMETGVLLDAFRFIGL